MTTPSKKPIINCHVHTFTLDHVPRRFFWYGLTVLLSGMPFKSVFGKLLRSVNPFSDRDILNRYADLLQTGGRRQQEEIFEEVQSYYPEDTRFVVLPMDMEFMGAGTAAVPLDTQHQQLAQMVAHPDYGHAVLPFVAIDPRRFASAAETLAYARRWLEKRRSNGERVFLGIKLYPALGFSPNDPLLHDLYGYCEAEGIPITSHTSRGGIGERNAPAREVHANSDPDSFRDVLDRFKNLKLCMAHFGGDEEWKKYFKDPKSRKKAPLEADTQDRVHMNWLTKIMQMIESGKYPNLYTDVSYTVFNVSQYLAPLSVILRDKPEIRARTLFGSDFYLAHQEEFEERYLAMELRHALGEEIFDAIARDNPREFLALT